MFCLQLDQLLMGGAMQSKEIAKHLGLIEAQVKVWLARATDEGLITKKARPPRYALAKSKTYIQEGLFGNNGR
jgi:transposase